MGEVITVPYKPRNWARQFHAAMKRFACLVLHRRCGKTTAVLNHHQRAALDDDWEGRRLKVLRPELTAKEADELMHPPGGRHYGHVMPTRVQAKMVAWDKLKFYARVIPGVKFNEQELLVRYPNGNKLQLFGADDPDTMRGFGGSGLSFDEYDQQPPAIFSEVLSKALAERLGYAIFIGTVKGRQALFRTYEAARSSPDWFALWQDIDRSLATEEGITIKTLEQAMADDRKLVEQGLMTQDELDQEWYLSTDAAIKGAFFGDEMRAALKAGRICHVPFDPSLPVDTDWDLGIDAMAVWFSQSTTTEVRLIDYEEQVGGGFPEMIRALKERPYVYGQHWGPHDIETREISSGLTRRQTARQHGINFEVTPKLGIAEGISAAKLMLARCYFDEKLCKHGIEALRQYRKTYNTRLETFTEVPLHNAASHGADAFRGLAVRWQGPREREAYERSEMPREWAWT